MIKFLVKGVAYGVVAYVVSRKLDNLKVAERTNLFMQPLKARGAVLMANLAKASVVQPNGREAGQ